MVKLILNNKLGTFFIVLALIFGGSAALMAGCSLADFYKVKAPSKVQQVVGVPPSVPLAEAGAVLAEYRDRVQADYRAQVAAGEMFADGIERGWQFVGFAQSMFNIGVAEAGASGLALLPGGALALAALTGLGGLFFPKPGSAARMQSEKEDSYNAGLEEGKRIALESVNGKTHT